MEIRVYYSVQVAGGLGWWGRIYCENCVKELDVVYNYYAEYTADRTHYTYYDLENFRKYHSRLAPSLKKI